MSPTWLSPPANATKKKSGKISEGRSRDGFVKTFFIVRHATPCATGQNLMSAASLSLSANAASTSETRAITSATPNPSASAFASQPVMIRLRTHSIRYETGLIVARNAEPVDGHQVPRSVHRRDEEEDEQEREEALDRLARAGAQGEEGAERAEAERDERREDEQDEDPERPRREVDARRSGRRAT